MTIDILDKGSYIKTRQTVSGLEKPDLSGYSSASSPFWPISVRVGQEDPLAQGPYFYQIGNTGMATFPMPGGEQPRVTYTTIRLDEITDIASLVRFGFKQLLQLRTQDWVEIYPGYRVSPTEYERRFKGVDLDHFREVMPLNLFKAFVRTMGSIEGWGIEPEHIYKGKD